MSLSDLASLGSFVSGVAVLVSLIFLYFQLRQLSAQVAQAEKNQRASIMQSRTDRTVAIALAATDPAMAEAFSKAFTGAQDVTTTQLVQFRFFCTAAFTGLDDSFYQHQDGLMTDSAFATSVNTMVRFAHMPSFRAQWNMQRTGYGAEFAEFMDRLVARTSVEPPAPVGSAAWLTALAAESSGKAL